MGSTQFRGIVGTEVSVFGRGGRRHHGSVEGSTTHRPGAARRRKTPLTPPHPAKVVRRLPRYAGLVPLGRTLVAMRP